MKKMFGAVIIAAALALAGSMSIGPVQAKPQAGAANQVQSADASMTDISAQRRYRGRRYVAPRYNRRYYRPYYRPYVRPYYRPYYQPYGYGYPGYGYYGRPGFGFGFGF